MKPTTPTGLLRRFELLEDLWFWSVHDPCAGIRAVPVVEVMTACVLADAVLRHRGQTGG